MKRFLIPVMLAAAIFFAEGCKPQKPDSDQPVLLTNAKKYPVRGKVVSTDAKHGEVTLAAAAIPGFMEAMTMPYKLRTPNILGELHPGDNLTATLYVTDTADLLDEIVITAQAQPDYKPPISYHVINPGDPVPDFNFLNQDGKRISIAGFKGKVLLLTFIYTRCPLPDYCPRMNANFAKIEKSLGADPALIGKTHLLSISFDPDFDTPAVLRSYGAAYAGNDAQGKFAHWDFAVPGKPELESVEKFFDVGVTPEKDNTITHSLSTVLIGPDGKVVRWYPTNDWSPDEVLNSMKQLAAKA